MLPSGRYHPTLEPDLLLCFVLFLDVVKSEKEAKRFLKTLMRGQTVNPETQNTDYHEECCIEGCKVEEIAEYCKLL